MHHLWNWLYVLFILLVSYYFLSLLLLFILKWVFWWLRSMYWSIICSSNCNTAFCSLYFTVLKSFSFPDSQYFFHFLKAFCLLLPLIFRSLLNLIAHYCPFLHLDLTSMSVAVSPEGFFWEKKEKKSTFLWYSCYHSFPQFCVLKNLYLSWFYRKCQ